MVRFEQMQKKALALPEAVEAPHFEKTSFRVRKKIFATCNADGTTAVMKLSQVDQQVFAAMGQGTVLPLQNSWGKQGWTLFDMKNVPAMLFYDALKAAYSEVAPKQLAEQIR